MIAPTIDLHMHSTASDGQLSPKELMKFAHSLGFKTVALADHDTLAGLPEARKQAMCLNMEFIGACEISAGGSPEMHILGYGVDEDCDELQALFSRMRKARELRMEQFIHNLNERGVKISYEDVVTEAGNNENAVGRPHLGRALVRLGYASDLRDAFARYLVPGAPTFVTREKVSIEEAIKTINAAKGAPVLAHPALLRQDLKSVEKLVIYMKKLGLVGLECHHPSHDREKACMYRRVANKHGLVITGGSDYHGGQVAIGQPLPMPGDGLGFFCDAQAQLNRLKEAIDQIKMK
ncbi:MAG: PHP domain-containing protein [Clostridia bacterium]|nr:PHP domain-containing protein [Clostridia bacterium]